MQVIQHNIKMEITK